MKTVFWFLIAQVDVPEDVLALDLDDLSSPHCFGDDSWLSGAGLSGPQRILSMAFIPENMVLMAFVEYQ